MRGFTSIEKVSIRSSGCAQAMPIWQMLAASLQAVSTSIAMNRKRPAGILSAWPKVGQAGAGAGSALGDRHRDADRAAWGRDDRTASWTRTLKHLSSETDITSPRRKDPGRSTIASKIGLVDRFLSGAEEARYPAVMTLSQTQIIRSLADALQWFEKELAWGAPVAELRHLTGRIGELYVAMIMRGQMALSVNQVGYDVVSAEGERITVKTFTSSTRINFNPATLHNASRVMILQIVIDEGSPRSARCWTVRSRSCSQCSGPWRAAPTCR